MTSASICNTKTTKQILFIILFLETLAVTVAIVGALAIDKSPAYYFKEIDRGGFITYISCLQLLIAAFLSWKTYKTVRYSPQQDKNRFWLVIASGLVFVAIDDAIGIHEQIDRWMHTLIGIEENDISDLIDDLIVGGYLALSLVYIALKWQAIRTYKQSFIFFKVGFILSAIMVVLDILSNNRLFVSMMIDNSAIQSTIQEWLEALEDSAKIFAEGMFIVGIYKCWQIAKSLNSDAERGRANYLGQ
jgi:hypothetical protein